MWSLQIEEGIDIEHQMPKIGAISISTRWLIPRSLLEEREFFLRLFERFVDSKLLLPGDIRIHTSFNLGKYFVLRRSEFLCTLCASVNISHILGREYAVCHTGHTFSSDLSLLSIVNTFACWSVLMAQCVHKSKFFATIEILPCSFLCVHTKWIQVRPRQYGSILILFDHIVEILGSVG